VDAQPIQLELLVQQIAEVVITTTDTVDHLAQQVDALTKQVQQQGYQIFALSDAVQTLAENQDGAIERLDRLTDVLQRLVAVFEEADTPSS
jgi:ABC-type transporter Mla subunit MlaD